MNQPEALRLADALYSNDPQGLLSQAAAELRRLSAVNEELLEALIEMMGYSGLIEERCDTVATNKARAAIAKAGGEA